MYGGSYKKFQRKFFSKETAYQNISDLYDNWPMPTYTVEDVERKTVNFKHGWLFINKLTSDDRTVSFFVNMNNQFMYYIMQGPDLNRIKVNSSTTMELGDFKQEVSTSKNTLQTIPQENREDVFDAFIGWTRESIREGRVTEPPYKLTTVQGSF